MVFTYIPFSPSSRKNRNNRIWCWSWGYLDLPIQVDENIINPSRTFLIGVGKNIVCASYNLGRDTHKFILCQKHIFCVKFGINFIDDLIALVFTFIPCSVSSRKNRRWPWSSCSYLDLSLQVDENIIDQSRTFLIRVGQNIVYASYNLGRDTNDFVAT